MQYLKLPVYLWYYKQINKAGSLESDVYQFYNRFLREIFTTRDNFVVGQESRVMNNENNRQKFDFTIIRYITNGEPKKVILCENKRRDGESQTSVWTNALAQVVEYANSVRQEQIQYANESLYLTVNVGTYLRFYELPKGLDKAIDWAPAGGHCYELANDEEEVWRLWNQLRDLVKSH